MREYRGASGLAVAALGSILACLPLVVGQGCPGTGATVIPITGDLGSDGSTKTNGNVAPTFRFTAPTGPVQAEVGDSVLLTWTDSDPDNNAQISIVLDPDSNPNNGNEVPIATGISEDDPTNALTINTASYALAVGSYRIVARINDGVNPEVMVAATGSLNMFGSGMSSGNVSPSISVAQPQMSLSISQGSQVTVNYCGNDIDGGEGGVVADVIILLDQDNNPLNDLFSGVDPTSQAAATMISNLCRGNLPATVTGAVVLGCAKDDKCTNAATGTNFPFTVDATKIPQTQGGEPYRVRVTMWDHTNPPVSAYAPGMLSMTGLATGTVDLGTVGRTKAGARFIGFDTGAQAGFTGTNVGDFDGDEAEDFILVARYGRPYERGNVGSAYMVYGMPNQRFGGDIYLNSYGLEYRGCCFASGHAGPYYKYAYVYSGVDQNQEAATDGITSVSSIEDLTGDGKPEIFFGLPYAELWYDYHDDDPCDKADFCYFDGMPNPLSTDDGNDDISAWDYREGPVTVNNVQYACSNDSDYFVSTPINQGYIVYVSSNNQMEDTVLDISMTGQKDPDPVALEEGVGVSGSSVPNGARLRGGWYTFSQTSYGIDPYNQFGRTLGSMPDLGDGGTSPRRDGLSEFLISMPSSYQKRGEVILTWGEDLGTFCGQPVQSIPDYEKTDGDPCYRTWYYPDSREIVGAMAGDELGYANRAGDFNRDGHQDILCGAPGADRNGVSDAGIVYVIFGRLDFGQIDLGSAADANDPSRQYVPRIEIRGTGKGDRFGETQTLLRDVNNDGMQDIAFASQYADGPGGTDCGYIGILFGNRRVTGEYSYTVNQVGTQQLPGIILYGTQTGGHAGATIADAGDFNHDNFDDLLICAPDETRTVNGQVRRGVAYLIFGGPHLGNNSTRNYFMLSEVGTSSLPGIVFISPYAQGTADEATIDWVGAAGDVDGDGFADILLGLSQADFVYPLDPSQRRIDAGEAYLVYGNNAGGNVVH